MNIELITKLHEYIPYNEQELNDRDLIIDFLLNNDNAFSRSNLFAHMTASSWIVNDDFSRVLMVYHNIYNSWSWTGGHADGDVDLLHVALKEAYEETGVSNIIPVTNDIFSVESLTVNGHIKNGSYVSSHLHLNVTYLLQASDDSKLTVCRNENSDVRWFALGDALKASTEKWFVDNIYSKLNSKLSSYL